MEVTIRSPACFHGNGQAAWTGHMWFQVRPGQILLIFSLVRLGYINLAYVGHQKCAEWVCIPCVHIIFGLKQLCQWQHFLCSLTFAAFFFCCTLSAKELNFVCFKQLKSSVQEVCKMTIAIGLVLPCSISFCSDTNRLTLSTTSKILSKKRHLASPLD